MASIAFTSSLENGPCCTDVPGNHKIKVLQGFVQFIKDLHAMCSTNKASIVAWGVSRGARWLEEIVRKRSVYLDVAVAKWLQLDEKRRAKRSRKSENAIVKCALTLARKARQADASLSCFALRCP